MVACSRTIGVPSSQRHSLWAEDLGEIGAVRQFELIHGPGKNVLQGVQIAALAVPVHFGPRPVDSPVMRMIEHPVVGENLAVRTIKRVDVIAPRNGVLAIAFTDAFAEPGRLVDHQVVVQEHRLLAIDDLNRTAAGPHAHVKRPGRFGWWLPSPGRRRRQEGDRGQER